MSGGLYPRPRRRSWAEETGELAGPPVQDCPPSLFVTAPEPAPGTVPAPVPCPESKPAPPDPEPSPAREPASPPRPAGSWRPAGPGRPPRAKTPGRQPCCCAPRPDHYITCDSIPMPPAGGGQ